MFVMNEINYTNTHCSQYYYNESIVRQKKRTKARRHGKVRFPELGRNFTMSLLKSERKGGL